MKKIMSVLLTAALLLGVIFAVPYSVSAAGDKNDLAGSDGGAIGSCTWAYDDADHTLVISGSGAMPDYKAYFESDINASITSAPWCGYYDEIEKIVVTDGVTAVGEKAFSGCIRARTIELGKDITSIGYSAFQYCFALGSMTIPSGVKVIESSLFYHDRSLESVVLPETVTNIKDCAFEGCYSLTGVTLPEKLEKLGSVFDYCYSLEKIKIPDSLKSIGGFHNCSSLEEVVLGKGVETITRKAFFGCENLKKINVPETVTLIANYALGYYEDENWNNCKVDGFTISGTPGSEANRYANDNGFEFVAVGSEEPTTEEPTTEPVGQKVYFEYPDSWSREGLTIDPETHLANVYCYAYPIYGNQTEFKMKWQTKSTRCYCEDCDGEQRLFSYDLAQNGTIEDGADYGVIFSTDAGGSYRTVDLTMTSRCIGDIVYAAPYNGTVSPQSGAEPSEYYAAWRNTGSCGPRASISIFGILSPGMLPVNQPRAQHLSNMLKLCLTSNSFNQYFQYENDMLLCEGTGVTPQEVYAQYMTDNAEYFVGEPETNGGVPCPFYRYTHENDQGQPTEDKLAAPDYVKEVLGLPVATQTGDTDGDGEIGIDDATLIQKHVAGLISKNKTTLIVENDPDRFSAADVNRDGIVSVSDVTLVQQYIAGMIDNFA